MSRARKMWVTAGAVVLLVVAGYLVVTRTHRLEHGDFWSVGEGAVIGRGWSDAAVHELRAGSTVRIALTVRNRERVAVNLSEVVFDTTDVRVDDMTMIERAFEGPQACCDPATAEAFRPVTLHRDDQVAVWLALHLTGANSYMPGTGFTLIEVTIRFRVLGMPRTQRLPLRTAIMFLAPAQ